MSFANMKRNRGSIDKLVAAAEASGGNGNKSFKDERMWRPTQDKAGNGYAVIRFLPAPENIAVPWVQYWDHGFKGPTGKWYIEKSLTTINEADPVGEMNSQLWNATEDPNSWQRKQAREQKRRLHYVANILVISDPGNPANEGKVMMYSFGAKIHTKIMDAMQPAFADEEPVNPFDFWGGANFKIKIRKVEGWTNYDKSEFDGPTELSTDDEYLEGIYNSLHPIQEFTDPAQYKSYAELKAKLNAVLGTQSEVPMAQQMQMGTESPAQMPREAKTPDYAQSINQVAASSLDADEEEDTMSYFAKLAAGE
jgi:hypothetical protein